MLELLVGIGIVVGFVLGRVTPVLPKIRSRKALEKVLAAGSPKVAPGTRPGSGGGRGNQEEKLSTK